MLPIMEVIWRPLTLVEGQLARNRLVAEGVHCHLAGEYLSGGLGELPAFGLYALMVDARQRERALALLVDWGLLEPGDELEA